MLAISKEVMGWVIEEVVINTTYNSYNHMVICRNDNNNTYVNLFFILI